MLRTLTVCAPLPCGKLAIMHAGGMLVFRSAQPSLDTSAQKWHAVFSDGSFITAAGSHHCVLRYTDGSTCKKVYTETASEDASTNTQMDWISTMHDGKRLGVRARDASGSETAGKVWTLTSYQLHASRCITFLRSEIFDLNLL